MVESGCIFCDIIARKIPAKVVHQDDELIVFHDVHPMAPVHLLIVPKVHVRSVNELESKQADIIGKMTHAAKAIAQQFEIAQEGYRLVLNTEKGAGQSVWHIHMHLLGGRKMEWPPG